MRKKKTYLLLSLLVYLALINNTSCVNNQESVSNGDRDLMNKINDSLAASGKHGYYTYYFMVGRLKTTLFFEGTPFEVLFTKINPEMLDKKIKFKILDGAHYQISYSINNKETSYVGLFDKKYENDYESVLVTKSNYLKQPEDNSIEVQKKYDLRIDNLKNNNYVLEIHKY